MITNTEAAKRVMDSIRYGSDFHGTEYCAKCNRMLKAEGSPKRPMDSTWMRYLRAYGAIYGIGLKDRATSCYHKKTREAVQLPLSF